MNIIKRTLAGLLIGYLAFGQVTSIPSNTLIGWITGSTGFICTTGDGNSAACDVGTTGARVRNGNAAGFWSAPIYKFGSAGSIVSQSDGVWTLFNNAGSAFGRLQFGGTTSSFVAAKRFGNALAIRAANDTVPTFATLTTCAAGGEGALSPVSDSTTAVWGATITGGGTDHVLAYCNGTNWTVAAK